MAGQKNRAAINKITDMYLCSAMLAARYKMIAEVKSDFAVKVGIYSPLCRMRFIVLIVKSCIR